MKKKVVHGIINKKLNEFQLDVERIIRILLDDIVARFEFRQFPSW